MSFFLRGDYKLRLQTATKNFDQKLRSCFMLLLPVLVGCAGSSAETVTQNARQVVIMVDRSASQSAETRAAHMRYLKSAIDSLDYNDQLVLLRVHESGARDESYQPFVAVIPARRQAAHESSLDRETKRGALKGAWGAAQTLFSDSTQLRHTDLFGTLFVASEYVKDADAREPVLIILSDMLQSARGVEMEGLRRMPTSQWVTEQKQAGTLPELPRACVFVVGADASSPAGMRVRNFWSDYFEASGSSLEADDYRLLPPVVPRMRC